MELNVSHIVKTFSLPSGGTKTAVNDISFTADSSDALGLLGRNGAGKTTTMRMIMDIFAPDSGTILLDGKNVHNAGIKVGYLPEERGLYFKSPVLEQMIYFARLKGIDKLKAKKECEDLLDKLQMSEYAKVKLETLSKGNQQKIQLAVAVLGDPDLLILDEPFSGLDPVNAAALKAMIAEQSARGAMVIFSSHQMAAVEDFCEHIVMIDKGVKVLDGKLSDIKREYPRDRVLVTLDSADASLYDSDAFRSAVAGAQGVEMTRHGAVIRLGDGLSPTALMSSVLGSGLPILRQEIIEPSLEDIFVEKAGKEEEE